MYGITVELLYYPVLVEFRRGLCITTHPPQLYARIKQVKYPLPMLVSSYKQQLGRAESRMLYR
jgi:hypothetical protein